MFQGEFTKVTNTLGPELAKTFVILWDIGPKKPVAPARPKAPKGSPGEAEYDLAMIEFKEELEGYEAALKAYGRAKTEFASWQEQQGGAIERTFYSCDAHDAMARDPDRYFISASTRGHEKAANHGLPKGVQPGKGHAENLRRMREGDDEFARMRAADPVFGQEMTR